MHPSFRISRPLVALALMMALSLGSCSGMEKVTSWNPLNRSSAGPGSADAAVAGPRVSGAVKPADDSAVPARVIVGDRRAGESSIRGGEGLGQGDVTLNFSETDIREVVRVILGELLRVTYTIDPTVKGTATIYTAAPVSRDALTQILVSLLAQNGAQLIQRDGIYNVVPIASAAPSLQGGGGSNAAETTEIVYLQYASAPQLAKVLAPFTTPTSRVSAGPTNNTVLVSGTATVRSSLVALVKSFDIDVLAGQSYAIFPVAESEPEKVAQEVRAFVQSTPADSTGPVRVVALERINAVLVVSQEPRYLERIARFIAQVDRVGDSSSRRLHVYYVQNGAATDLAGLLQKSFAPQGGSQSSAGGGSLAPNVEPGMIGSSTQSGQASGALGASSGPGMTTAGLGGGQTSSGATGSSASPGGSGNFTAPLSASMSSSSTSGTSGMNYESEAAASSRGMRFVADPKNNALLIYATPAEYKLIESTLRKIDILPLQVLVEATVAEVTLNDNLQYGTQFFLKTGALTSTLSNLANGTVSPEFPGFAFAFSTSSAQVALSALKSVTRVKVVSDPQILVLNNESARLQVGDLVPITTQTSQSTVSAGAPIVSSVDYKETGVILQVTPRVNSGGLVTLDLQQEVSDVVRTSTSTINSPTIQQRKLRTRIVAQDGETVGLGGLIKDSNTVSNSGIPWLTDIPVLGALFGSRSHLAGRTELLILLTPRVIRDQRTVRDLTEDLRVKLGALGSLPIVRDPIEPPGPLR